MTKKQEKVEKTKKEATKKEATKKEATKKETAKKTTQKTKKETTKKSSPKKEQKHFFKDVKSELKKVRWPLKKEMITYSIATLVFMAILGLFFIATDLIIAGVRMVFI